MSIVDAVFQLRSLLGRCELGAGLELDDIDRLSELEIGFEPGPDDRHTRDGRRYRRERVVMSGHVRGSGLNDRIVVRDLGPGGAMIGNAPYAEVGQLVELVLDHAGQSFRFKAQIRWVREDGDEHVIGLAFVGLPVRLTYGPPSERGDNVIHRIAA